MLGELASLILNRQNAAKLSPALLAERSGIRLEIIKEILAANYLPNLPELVKLSRALGVRLKDFLPPIDDTQQGVKIVTADESNRTRRVIHRAASGQRTKPYYVYRDLAFTLNAFHARGVILDLLCTQRKDVVQNRGHFQDSLTFVLRGPIEGYWEDSKGQTISKVLMEGDSYFARGFVPHTYRSLDRHTTGRILSFTSCQHLSGDTQEELMLQGWVRGADNISAPGPYANLVSLHRNNGRYNVDQLAQLSGVLARDIRDFEMAKSIPSIEQLRQLASALRISVSELIPFESDLHDGRIHQTRQESLTSRRILADIKDESYAVSDLAAAKEASFLRGHRIEVLRRSLRGVPFHFFSSEYTTLFVYQGSVDFKWRWLDRTHTRTLNLYDSVCVLPFVPYAMASGLASEVLTFQYPNRLAGNARKELFHKGKEGLKRIVREGGEWSRGQS